MKNIYNKLKNNNGQWNIATKNCIGRRVLKIVFYLIDANEKI